MNSTLSPITVAVGGSLWWNGFTADFTITNTSSTPLNSWTYSFDTVHKISGNPWGATFTSVDLGNGITRYTLTGAGWASSIPPGGSVTIGFNGAQGKAIGNSGSLTSSLLFTNVDANTGGHGGEHHHPDPDPIPDPVVDPDPVTPTDPVVDPNPNTDTGRVFAINPAAADIIGFNPALDRLDFGDVSVHNLIVGKTSTGEVAIINPWAWTPEFQVIRGVSFTDLTAANFGIVQNEHLRQDIGGVISWELGLGARNSNTVYVRSHEYGVQERIENFDPTTMKLSFLYYGTRERLTVSDAAEGLLIATQPTGQTLLLVGITRSQLIPANLEFHHDQVVEDRLEDAFGVTVDQVTIVSRTGLATPEGPAGQITDGHQSRPGNGLTPIGGGEFSGGAGGHGSGDDHSHHDHNYGGGMDNGSGPDDGMGGGTTEPPVTDPGPVTPPPPDPVFPNNPFTVTVAGNRWWNGFTAELTVTNVSGSQLNNWSFSFDTVHKISGSPWGATVQGTDLGGGVTRYTVTGSEWAASIAPGGAVKVGFNGTQGTVIGNDGGLNADLLFLGGGIVGQTGTGSGSNGGETPTNPNPPTDPINPDPNPVDPPAIANGEHNYGEALQKSFLFYEANRSGDLDENTKRIDWRGDSGLRDGRDGIYFGGQNSGNLQASLSLDLTGGYHDAGDHGKFGLPLASTLTTLAWGGVEFSDGYQASGQMDDLLTTIRWGTDYLLKAHVTNANGETVFFVAQVGNVSADHSLWSAPESQTIARPAMAVTPDKPGSDVAAGSAAALAAASILFREAGDFAYADELLVNAQSLYRFADTYRGKYSDSIPEVRNYYNSWSGYEDELAYGAAWLSRAVSSAGGDGSAYLNQALNIYNSSIGGLSNGWTHNWDDASYGTAVILAQDTGNQAIKQDVTRWLDAWVNGTDGVQITDGGLRFISQWGSLRYAANTAMLAAVYSDGLTDPTGKYAQLAQDTVDYILGSNPRNASYMVGYGNDFPQQPHHRAASGVGWDGFRNGLPNEHILFGALVGGPTAANDFSYNDSRDDYISNEVAIDYNAGLTGALAWSVEQFGGNPLTAAQLNALPGISVPQGM
ncbi:glycoside hydrolase family 9 protein [Synechocystis sp. PCC 7339]|uniref:glycoside hydrolase family 9 protein n=1 Tax=Synechocystis sp. PCC 7339 TaxID=2782213 RepID=UPI001CC052C6|nr:glycoside hydrolase family 9 protein [Synechocystis sp. PCC 7339]UAJ71804.1 glycoside hydrolase family 9 protein [Synechocystis sp. PCC 7339]